MKIDELRKYISEAAERRYGPRVPDHVRRNAYIGEHSDPLRAEFLGILDEVYRKDMWVLFELCERDISLAESWLKTLKLYSPWLMEVLKRWWNNNNPRSRIGLWLLPNFPPDVPDHNVAIKMSVLAFGEAKTAQHKDAVLTLIQKEKVDWTPPIEHIPGPRPWDETEAHFLERCKGAWNKNATWSKKRGLKSPAKLMRRAKTSRGDKTRDYILALLHNRLSGQTQAKLAEELGIELDALKANFKKLDKRLNFSGKKKDP